MNPVLCLVLACAAAVVSHMHFQCTEDFCDRVRCNNNLTCGDNQQLRQNRSACRCCPACVTILGEGDRCCPRFHGGGPFLAECGPNLTCTNCTCTAQ